MKIAKITIASHPLLSGKAFNFLNKDGFSSPYTLIAGQNGLGKTAFLESITCLSTRFKDSQPQQIAVFDYELTDSEFETLVSDKLSQIDWQEVNRKKISVKVISQFRDGKYVNSYEFQLYKDNGDIIWRDDLSEGFEAVRKVIYISLSGTGLRYVASETLNFTADGSEENSMTIQLKQYFEQMFPFVKKMTGYSEGQKVAEIPDGIVKEDLSAGEKQILSIGEFFIRHATSLYNSIILIDEPENYLHPEWQKKIIDLFDKIAKESGDSEKKPPQFVFTTHSPYFLKNYIEKDSPFFIFKRDNADNLVIRSTSDFEEGTTADVLKETYNIDFFIFDTGVIFVEGETDEMYISKCIEVYEMHDFPFQIRWVGRKSDKGQVIFTGKDALNKLEAFLSGKEEMIKFPVVLLYDCDSNKEKKEKKKLLIEALPFYNHNPIFQAGIENIFEIPQNLDLRRFYTEKKNVNKYGGKITEEEFRKMEFCLYVCSLPKEEAKAIFIHLHNYLCLLNTLSI